MLGALGVKRPNLYVAAEWENPGRAAGAHPGFPVLESETDR